jgi:hypothetical protein
MATHSSLTPAMFASIVSIVYRTVFFEPSYHAAICGVTSKKSYLSQLGVVLRTPETPVNRTGCMEFQKPAFYVAMWMASICTIS